MTAGIYLLALAWLYERAARWTTLSTWHPGKLAFLWGAVGLTTLLLYAGPAEEEVIAAVLATLPLALPVAIVTWCWLSGRERRSAV